MNGYNGVVFHNEKEFCVLEPHGVLPVSEFLYLAFYSVRQDTLLDHLHVHADDPFDKSQGVVLRDTEDLLSSSEFFSEIVLPPEMPVVFVSGLL